MFAPLTALLGGACLGVSSVAVLAQTGGILGISGIVGCGMHWLSAQFYRCSI